MGRRNEVLSVIFSESQGIKVGHGIPTLERRRIRLVRHVAVLPSRTVAPLRSGLGPPRPVHPALRGLERGHLSLGICLEPFLVCVRVGSRVGIGFGAAARLLVRRGTVYGA